MERGSGGLQKLALLIRGLQPGQFRENHIRDRQHKHAGHNEIQIVRQIDHRRAVPAQQVGAEPGVDHQVDGLRPGADHGGEHQGVDLAHPLRPRAGIRHPGEPFLPQGRHLHQHLQTPRQQKHHGQAVDPEPPVEREVVEDNQAVGHRADERRDIELIQGLQDPHKGERQPREKDRGEHDPGQPDAQLRRGRIEPVRHELHQRLGQEDPGPAEHQRHDADHRQEIARELKRLPSALSAQILRKDRNEAGRDGGGENHIKKDPGDSAGHEESVALHTQAVVDREKPVPHQAQHLAKQGENHHQPDGFHRAVVSVCHALPPLPAPPGAVRHRRVRVHCPYHTPKTKTMQPRRALLRKNRAAGKVSGGCPSVPEFPEIGRSSGHPGGRQLPGFVHCIPRPNLLQYRNSGRSRPAPGTPIKE